MTSLEVVALTGLPLIKAGDDLAGLIASSLEQNGVEPRAKTCLSSRRRSSRRPRAAWSTLRRQALRARRSPLAAEVDKDPRLVEVILSEFGSRRAGAPQRADRRAQAWLRHGERQGWTNRMWDRADRRPARASVAGESGPQRGGAAPWVSAQLTGIDLAVVINDSFGRAWRQGTAGVAIGAAGLPALIDLRGRPDLFGRKLEVSVIGFADEIAAAASLVMGQADEAGAGRPSSGACAGRRRNRQRPA